MNEPAMNRLKKVCFATTGGPGDADAFERTLRLCERARAELSIVSVVEVPPPGIFRLIESWGVTSEVADDARGEAAELERLLEMARRRNIVATGEVLRGRAFLEIIRKVQEGTHDLLVKAPQTSTIIRHQLFGYTDRQLVRECPCPVWIEKPSEGTRHSRILAAVDPAPFNDDLETDLIREELNTSILQWATLLAHFEEAELHVVHVWHFYLEGPLQSRAGLTADAVAEVGESFKQKHEQALASLLGPYSRHIAQVHLIKGEAADEISRLAASEDFDVVVLGTVCRTGIAGWLIGNTAERILNSIECSMLALKPGSSISPIRLGDSRNPAHETSEP